VIDIIGEPVFASGHSGSEAKVGTSAGFGDGVVRAESDADLYRRLAPDLIRFAAALVGPSDAEDLLGSAVTKVIASARWVGVANKRAYLYRMLVNEAHKWRRTTSRRSARELRIVRRDAVELELGLDPDVLVALKRLSVRQRAVIHLTYWADLSPRQVAETLDTSLRTVERELTTARTRLGELLS
jgi:RNA polymerase sigma factor (sigma-70 family)